MKNNEVSAARRQLLRAGLGAVAAGVALASVAGTERAVAQDKLAKDAVQYQEMPKDGAKCSTCVNFVAPNACNIVAGNINPNGWCIAYGPKSG